MNCWNAANDQEYYRYCAYYNAKDVAVRMGIDVTYYNLEQTIEAIWNSDRTCKTKRDIVRTAAALSKTIAPTG